MRENVILTFDVARPRLQSVQTSFIRQTNRDFKMFLPLQKVEILSLRNSFAKKIDTTRSM